MLERVSDTLREDTLVPTLGVGDTATVMSSIFQPISHSPASPTSRLFKKQRKQKHTQSYYHLAASASVRLWHARYWQSQRPIFLFLCCCFKSKARMAIWKQKNTDTLTLQENHGSSKSIPTGIPPRLHRLWHGTWFKSTAEVSPGKRYQLPGICHPELPGSATRMQSDAPAGAKHVTQGRQFGPAKQMWLIHKATRCFLSS